ncbi:MAG: TonB-dependent receptor [Bacteroidales bacterium]|nr:TonB-dependent receptor [Bacteroidales bacterium]
MTAGFLLSALTLLTPLNDTVLTEVTVTAPKESVSVGKIASPVTVVRSAELESGGIYRPNDLSFRIPGLHIPDYGASLTSSIYIRGLGSRMENPVIGLYIDGIPVLDKNAYDFDWEGIQSVTMLRGPQGTLYGRNAMGGVLSLSTLSPSSEARSSMFLEYGTANTCRVGLSFLNASNVFSATYRHGDGYFDNVFKGAPADPYDGLSLRWKWVKSASDRLFLTNVLSAGVCREGGFAYGRYEDGVLSPVSYNDEGGYRRLSAIEGLRLDYRTEEFVADAVASLQFLADDMRMDQDFTPASVFTLRQQQQSAAATVELNLRRADNAASWQPVTGFFAFYRHNAMSAPVVFKREGIENLILYNANANIPDEIGYLTISDAEMPVLSDFVLASWNAALFHESVFRSGDWQFTAGLRLDYEGGLMDYDCLTTLHYRFFPTMSADKACTVAYRGTADHFGLVLLPKLSALYEASDPLKLFVTVSRGYRAGGFNTQIFSDILQQMMMKTLMKDLGVYLERPSSGVEASASEYDPESAWNFETGLRYRKQSFSADASVYYMAVTNQQLTVFPPGQNTGRMMTNAGRSRSLGAETQLAWQPGDFHSRFSWAWCDARFVRYQDGNNDHAGNRVPYVPAHTLFLGAGYIFRFGGCSLAADASLAGCGPQWWNEGNTLDEPVHLFLDGRLALVFPQWEVYLGGGNLTDTRGHSFYFKSVGKEFFASVKPRIFTIGLSVKL